MTHDHRECHPGCDVQRRYTQLRLRCSEGVPVVLVRGPWQGSPAVGGADASDACRDEHVPLLQGPCRVGREDAGGGLSCHALQAGCRDASASPCSLWLLARQHQPGFLQVLEHVLVTKASARRSRLMRGDCSGPDCGQNLSQRGAVFRRRLLELEQLTRGHAVRATQAKQGLEPNAVGLAALDLAEVVLTDTCEFSDLSQTRVSAQLTRSQQQTCPSPLRDHASHDDPPIPALPVTIPAQAGCGKGAGPTSSCSARRATVALTSLALSQGASRTGQPQPAPGPSRPDAPS